MTLSIGRYRQVNTMHGRLSKGGYMYGYNIIDTARDRRKIGALVITVERRGAPEKRVYSLLNDDRTFETSGEFINAYEASDDAKTA